MHIIENFQTIHSNETWVKAKYLTLGAYTTDSLQAAHVGASSRFAIQLVNQAEPYAIGIPLPNDPLVVVGFRLAHAYITNPTGAQVGLGRVQGQEFAPLVTLSIDPSSLKLNYAQLNDDGVSYSSEEISLPIPSTPDVYIDFSVSRTSGNNFTLYIANEPVYVGNLLPSDNGNLCVIYGALPKQVTAPYSPTFNFATASTPATTLPINLADFYVGPKRLGSPEVYTTSLVDAESTQETNTNVTPEEIIELGELNEYSFIGGVGSTSANVTRDDGVIDDGQITVFSQQNVPDATDSINLTVGTESVTIVPKTTISASTANFRRYPNVKIEVQ